MTPTPGQPLSEADVSLLKKGDLLRDPDGISWFEFSQDGWVYALDAKEVRMGFQPKHVTFLGRPDQDGWIAHEGGENPVPGLEVTIQMRGELIPTEVTDDNTGLSDAVYWDHRGGRGDIIAYRPHAPVSRPGDGVNGSIEALDRLKIAAHVYEDDEMAADCATLEAALTPPAEPVSRPAGEGEAGKMLAKAMWGMDLVPARVSTDDLVDRFADALKAKLRAAGEKYGFDDAWKQGDWREKLIEDLWRHVQKGDPRDVAAYCAFAWYHGWSLSLGEPPAGEGEREAVARIIADHFSGGFDASLQDKQEWKDRSGLGYDCEPLDVNGPFKDDYLSAADAILSLLRPAAGGGWMPIETAPKDGSLILCFYPERHGHDRYSLRYWSRGDWPSSSRTEGWCDQYRQLRPTDPTHWMPLPATPALQPGGER